MIIKLPENQPKRFTLLDTANVLYPEDTSWIASDIYAQDTSTCATGEISPMDCATGINLVTEPNAGAEVNSTGPLHLVNQFGCNVSGHAVDHETYFVEGATKALKIAQSQLLENYFYCSTLTNAAYVTHTETGGPYNPTQALSLMETFLAESIGVGMIHAPVGLAPFFHERQLVIAKGDHFETKLGTKILFGAGYSGDSICGTSAATGTAWLFATQIPTVVFSPITTTNTFDRKTNTVTGVATRYAAVLTPQCGHMTIQAEAC